jgi:hypothetical protein
VRLELVDHQIPNLTDGFPLEPMVVHDLHNGQNKKSVTRVFNATAQSLVLSSRPSVPQRAQDRWLGGARSRRPQHAQKTCLFWCRADR